MKEVLFEPKEQTKFRFSITSSFLLKYSKWHINLKKKKKTSLFFRAIDTVGWLVVSLQPATRAEVQVSLSVRQPWFSFYTCPKSKLTSNSACHIFYYKGCFLANAESFTTHLKNMRIPSMKLVTLLKLFKCLLTHLTNL